MGVGGRWDSINYNIKVEMLLSCWPITFNMCFASYMSHTYLHMYHTNTHTRLHTRTHTYIHTHTHTHTQIHIHNIKMILCLFVKHCYFGYTYNLSEMFINCVLLCMCFYISWLILIFDSMMNCKI